MVPSLGFSKPLFSITLEGPSLLNLDTDSLIRSNVAQSIPGPIYKSPIYRSQKDLPEYIPSFNKYQWNISYVSSGSHSTGNTSEQNLQSAGGLPWG